MTKITRAETEKSLWSDLRRDFKRLNSSFSPSMADIQNSLEVMVLTSFMAEKSLWSAPVELSENMSFNRNMLTK